MRLSREVIYAAAIASFTLSFIIHSPDLSRNIYSDIVSFWYREGWYERLKIPYIDASFEYPPLAGFLTLFAAALGSNLASYYSIFSAIILIFYMLMIEVVIRFCDERGIGLEYALILLCLSPSMILYSVYNYDTIFASLIVLSLFLLVRGRLTSSAIAFSTAALVKLINLITLPFILLYVEGWRNRVKYALISIGIFASVNLALWLLNPAFIKGTYLYHVEWGLENAWYLILFPSSGSWDTAKIFGAALMIYGLLKVYLQDGAGLIERVFMALSVFLLTNYVFTPQMLLWLLPLLAMMGRLPIPYFFLDLANAGIIILWFETPNPLSPGSPPQILALLRAVTLFMILLEVYFASRGARIAEKIREMA
ncbi:MAG: hypothetical protein QXJ99_04460 [Thermofilum sp.]